MVLRCLVTVMVVVLAGSGGLAGRFWHITDLHLDWNYVAGGNTTDMCHRSSSSVDPGVGPGGSYQCDAPAVLVMAMLAAMKRIEPHPDFILWTGDSGPHYWNPTPSMDYITNVTKTVFTELDQLFPGATVFPVLGNHDSDPPDTFYDTASKASQNGTQYDKYWKAGAFGDHIGPGPNMRETFKRCGYYMKPFTTKKGHTVRFIVLNTGLYYNNKAVEEEPVSADPCGQLAWLEERLNETLATPDQMVYLAAHVPPGGFERNPTTNNFFTSPVRFVRDIEKRLLEVVSRPRYAERIHAHFYGHTHTDSFRLLLDRATRQEARGVGFIGVSGTPLLYDKNRTAVGLNPGMRLFEFSDDDGTLLDYKQYGISLDEVQMLTSKEQTGSKSRRKLDPVDPELVPTTTLLPDTTPPGAAAASPARERRQGEASVASGQNVALIRTNSTDEFTSALLSKSTEQLSQSAQLLGLEQNSAANQSSANSTAASFKPLNTNTTSNSAASNVSSVITASSNVSVAEIKGSDTSATVVGTGTEEQALVDKLADQFQLVYSARESFAIKNLSASEMFQAFKSMATKKEDGGQSKTFLDYYAHNTNGHQIGDGSCDAVCFREQLCTISNILRDELVQCLNSSDDFLLYSKGQSNATALLRTTVSAAKQLRTTTTTSPPTSTSPPARIQPVRPTQPTLPPEVKLLADEEPDEEEAHTTSTSSSSNRELHSGGSDGTVQAKPIQGEDITVKATAIFFSLLGVALLMGVGAFAYKRYRANRYRNQEFLLTDSVFRYDGYSQLDDF